MGPMSLFCWGGEPVGVACETPPQQGRRSHRLRYVRIARGEEFRRRYPWRSLFYTSRRVISGLGDFAEFVGRYQQVLKGMRRGREANRKIPFIMDMIEWANSEYLHDDVTIPSRAELYTADVLGLFPRFS